MKLVNEKLACDLLEAGKKEFLSKGFQKASMRSIAASINVTTGALYRYYKDKEALFDAIVKEPAYYLERRYKNEQESFFELYDSEVNRSDFATCVEGYNWMIDYIYDNYDAFKLIICCSNNTKYENYVDRLIEIEADSSRRLIDQMNERNSKKLNISDNLIHIVVTTFFNGVFEIVAHDIPKEEAKICLKQLRDFYSAGWFEMLKI